MKKNIRTAITWFLTGALTFSSVPVDALATVLTESTTEGSSTNLVLDSDYFTDGDAELLGSSEITESNTEEADVPSSDEGTAVRDWSSEKDRLLLTLREVLGESDDSLAAEEAAQSESGDEGAGATVDMTALESSGDEAAGEAEQTDSPELTNATDATSDEEVPDSVEGSDASLALSMALSFPTVVEDDPVRAGDTITFALPTDVLVAEDTEEAVDVFAFVAPEGAAPDGLVAYLTTADNPEAEVEGEALAAEDEALDVKIAEYVIADGVVTVTFTEGVESDEVRGRLAEVFGKLEIPFAWAEGVQTEEEQDYVWTLQTYTDESTNEATLVIPALEKEQEQQTEEQQTDEQTEEQAEEEQQTEDLATTPALMSVSTLADSSYTMTGQKYTGKSEDRHIYWIDNNDGQNIRPDFNPTVSGDDLAKLRFSATFTYTVGSEKKTETITDLTWAQITDNTSSISMTDLGGTGHWVLSATNLLSSANVDINGTSRSGTFSDWTINTTDDHVFATDDYASVYVTSANYEGTPVDQEGNLRPSAEDRRGWFYVQELDYTSEIHLRTGTKTEFDQDELDNLKEAILAEYSFFWKTGIMGSDGNDLNSGSTALDASPDWMTITWDDTGDHLVGTVTVPALEKYNLDGSELIFYVDGDENKDVTITVPKMETGDYLAESVVNDDVSNWGTNVTEVYSGGDLILTLTGTTEYTATKEWHDKADSSDRPQVDFYLWRFTDKGTETDIDTAYQTAAAVKATNGTHSGQTAQVTIQAKSTGDSFNIDFSKNFLDDDDTQTKGYLPKYDPEGYRYVYICREYMTGDSASRYETEYGKLVGDTFKDTLPTGYTGTRTAYDNSIYNGGTVSNLLTGTTTAPVTKTWVANAFQSELEDTIVELTLYSRVKTADDSAQWTATSTTYRMGESTPFIAEFLTQSHSVTVPKYNNEGEELQYCWVETGVYQGEDSDNNLLNPSTSTTDKTFTLTQKEQQVDYQSQSEYKPNADGTYSTTITNRIEDTTEYYVRKVWDESITDQPPVSLRMYRTGVDNTQQMLTTKNGKDFQLDGTADSDPTPLYYGGVQVGQVQETSPWYAEFTELDKYDANGSQYDFIVFEGNPGTWTPEYSTDKDDQGNTIRVITNRPGPGSSISLYLRKRWLDDGDEQHRGTVTYTIYNIPEANRGNITNDVLSANGVQVQTAEISREDEWWKQVYLNGVTDNAGILVLETRVASTDASGEPVDIRYTDKQLNEIFKLQHPSSDTSVTAPYVTYDSKYHRYEASYSMVNFEGNQFYTVTNRRLGNIDIEVTKTWKDGSTDTQMSEQRQEFLDAIDGAGYELVFQLVSNSSEVKIDYEKNTVTAGNEAVKIQKKDGTEASAIQVLNKKDNTSVYEFYNLPKYDSMGRLVSYSVKEMLRPKSSTDVSALVAINNVINEKNIDTDYSFTITQSGYTVSEDEGQRHDTQTFSAVNQLTGSKDVFFWKEWNDAYRYNLGERPDLYLDLYQVKHDEDGTEKTPESVYLDRRWQFKDEWISLCDFGSMPKYDEYGFEITYYAQEKILINKEAFDYTDVYYKYSTEMEDKDVLAGGQTYAQEDLNEHVNELNKIGDESGAVSGSGAPANVVIQNEAGTYLLKEYGIFVNELQADVVFNGKKIWANIPTGFLEEDLVDVTFRLYQFVSGNEPDNSSNTQTIGNDGKYYLTGVDGTSSPEYASITIKDWSAQKYNGEYVFAIEYQGGNENTVGTDGTITVTSADGENLSIPKYDEDGNLYAYVMRESGDFSNTDAENNTGLVFKQPTINNYAITNPYESQKGKITIKKLLDTDAYQDTATNPSVSFTLTRQYTKADGITLQNDDAFSKTEIINCNEFTSGEGTVKFEDLEIYAPNGTKYVYTVTENVGSSELIQGGYVVSAGLGNLETGSDDLKKCENDNYQVTGLYPRQDQTAGDQFLNFLTSIPRLLGITSRDGDGTDTSYATYKNEYEKEYAPLQFTKKWDDGGYSNLRFVTPMTFTVKYAADSQPGMNNAITEKTAGTFKITLTEADKNKTAVTVTAEDGNLEITEDADPKNEDNEHRIKLIKSVTITAESGKTLATSTTWTIKVEEFMTYAPNGMPWKYTLTETDVFPYMPTGNDRVFTYDPVKKMLTCGTNIYTNTTKVSMSATKNPRSLDEPTTDYSSSSTGIWNLTGYDVVLTFEVYAKYVQADTWTQAEGKFLEEGTAGEKWISLADYNDQDDDSKTNPVWNELLKNTTITPTSGLRGTVTYENNTSYGKKTATSAALLRAVDVEGKTYFFSYIFAETGLEMKEEDTVVYKETFAPKFTYTKVPDGLPSQISKDVYANGDPVVAYYFETEAYCLSDIATKKYTKTDYLYMTPAYQSEQDVVQKVEQNKSSITYEEWLPYVWITGYRDNKSSYSTFINDEFNYIKTVDLDATKEWKDDNNNTYNTRPEINGQWVVDYQIQQSSDNGKTWTNFNAGARYQAITGGDNNSTKTVSYKNLPASGIIEVTNDAGNVTGYKVAEAYKYQLREKDPANYDALVEESGSFNEAYHVTYTDPNAAESVTDKNDKWVLKVTNTLQTTELFADKGWTGVVTSPVKLELQYKSTKTDTEGNNIWKSFDTPAEVTLDGDADTGTANKAYYEYESWKAKWTGVPKVMPGSVKTGDGKTEYRVVEVAENAYGSVTTGTLTGTGTQSNPYVLVGTGTSEDEAYTITNELTELKVQKVVDKPGDNGTGQLYESGQEFEFTIKAINGNMSGCKVYYKINGDVEAAKINNNVSFSFNLKDGEEAIIYGLKKNVKYEVVETAEQGYSVSYTVNRGDPSTKGEVTIPVEKPAAAVPTVIATNSKKGKLTVIKNDKNDSPLEGVTFKLEKKNDSTGNWDEAGQSKTTGKDGQVVFENLELGKTYRIVETKVPGGYNKLGKPIEVTLPFETTTAPDTADTNKPFYTVTDGSVTKYYYTDVTMTIGNNTSLTMPTTAGRGFFWPGMLGLAIVTVGCGVYFLSGKSKRRDA